MAHNKTSVSLEQTIGYICSNCSHNVFVPKMMIRKVSRFITGGEQDDIIPIDILVCDNCNEIAKDLIPKQAQAILFNNDISVD